MMEGHKHPDRLQVQAAICFNSVWILAHPIACKGRKSHLSNTLRGAAMAAVHHHLCAPRSLQRRAWNAMTAASLASLLQHQSFQFPGFLCFPLKAMPKLHHASNIAPCVENKQRYGMLDIPDNVDNIDHLEGELTELLNDVKSMIEMGNKGDAIDLLKANYEVVKEQMDGGFKGIEQAAILDILALGYLIAGDLNLVENMLDMLNEIVSSQHDNEPLLVSILMHMGSMFSTLGKFEDAIHVYGRGLKILEGEFGNSSPFLMTPLMGMAKVLSSTRRSNKSIAIYHRSIGILEKSRGPESEELVMPLLGLGNLFISEGKATDGEACFRRILSIYTKLYGETDGRVGMAMCSLAHVMCAKGNVEEAIVSYRRGLQVVKYSKYMHLDDNVLERMKIDLAELLHGTGREEEGRELLQECLLITECYKGIEHPSSVAHLLNLATSYSRSKNFVEAERLLRTCLHLMSNVVGPEDQSITVPTLHLAVALYHLKQDKEAEKFALEVVRIREGAFGKQSLPVGEALDCLVPIQIRLGKDAGDILANLTRILNIQEKEMGYESEEVMETLKKVVFYMDKTGKDEKLPLQRRLSLLRTKYKQHVPV